MINLVDDYYPVSANYPQIIKAVGERIRTYLAELLYPDEEEEDALERILIADIGASSDEAVRKATEFFGSNQEYPFTAYNFGDFEIVTDRKNTRGAIADFYCDTLSSKVSVIPFRQDILSMTFTNNPDDYERIQKILLNSSASLTMIYAPLVVNSITYQYPVRLEFIPTKGNYAFAFTDYLRMNGIYDIIHNFNCFFYEMTFDSSGIYPIDAMTINLDNMSPIDVSLSTMEYTKDHVRTDIPEVVSSDPEEEEEDVPVGNSIVLTFNVTMDETYVEEALMVSPYFEHKLIWDDDSKILIIDPVFDLTAGTEYTITIGETARAFHIYDTMDEYELTFTTEES
jgi:hypothetical protein